MAQLVDVDEADSDMELLASDMESSGEVQVTGSKWWRPTGMKTRMLVGIFGSALLIGFLASKGGAGMDSVDPDPDVVEFGSLGKSPCGDYNGDASKTKNGFTFSCPCNTNQDTYDDISLVLTPCEKNGFNCGGARRRIKKRKTLCSEHEFKKDSFNNKFGLAVFSAGSPSRRRERASGGGNQHRRRRSGRFADVKKWDNGCKGTCRCTCVHKDSTAGGKDKDKAPIEIHGGGAFADRSSNEDRTKIKCLGVCGRDCGNKNDRLYAAVASHDACQAYIGNSHSWPADNECDDEGRKAQQSAANSIWHNTCSFFKDR